MMDVKGRKIDECDCWLGVDKRKLLSLTKRRLEMFVVFPGASSRARVVCGSIFSTEGLTTPSQLVRIQLSIRRHWEDSLSVTTVRNIAAALLATAESK